MTNSPFPKLVTADLWRANRAASKWSQRTVVGIFGLFAMISVFTTFGIFFTLVVDAAGFFEEVSLWQFLTDTRWTPLFFNKNFGISVLITSTLMTTSIALCICLPVGLLAAICLSEYAPSKARKWLKPALEILSGVPSVVYGYFALLFVTPILKSFIPGLQSFNALSAGLVLGVSILPLVASLSEDAIYSVPDSLRQGSYGLGATKRETITNVILPAALSGIVSSFILAISRAIGETMIVTIAAGQSTTLNFNPLESVSTMTAFIVQVSLGDAPAGGLAFKTIYAVGLTLFLITLSLNVLSYWFVRRYRQKYE
jgi:phosphate transport system permease protein